MYEKPFLSNCANGHFFGFLIWNALSNNQEDNRLSQLQGSVKNSGALRNGLLSKHLQHNILAIFCNKTM
jgi:hypothetical protein